jgi:hypothetical protein
MTRHPNDLADPQPRVPRELAEGPHRAVVEVRERSVRRAGTPEAVEGRHRVVPRLTVASPYTSPAFADLVISVGRTVLRCSIRPVTRPDAGLLGPIDWPVQGRLAHGASGPVLRWPGRLVCPGEPRPARPEARRGPAPMPSRRTTRLTAHSDRLGHAAVEAGFGAQLPLRFVTAAYERRSFSVVSPGRSRASRFLLKHSTVMALLDRLLRHRVVVVTSGDSYRPVHRWRPGAAKRLRSDHAACPSQALGVMFRGWMRHPT